MAATGAAVLVVAVVFVTLCGACSTGELVARAAGSAVALRLARGVEREHVADGSFRETRVVIIA